MEIVEICHMVDVKNRDMADGCQLPCEASVKARNAIWSQRRNKANDHPCSEALAVLHLWKSQTWHSQALFWAKVFVCVETQQK